MSRWQVVEPGCLTGRSRHQNCELRKHREPPAANLPPVARGRSVTALAAASTHAEPSPHKPTGDRSVQAQSRGLLPSAARLERLPSMDASRPHGAASPDLSRPGNNPNDKGRTKARQYSDTPFPLQIRVSFRPASGRSVRPIRPCPAPRSPCQYAEPGSPGIGPPVPRTSSRLPRTPPPADPPVSRSQSGRPGSSAAGPSG